MSRKFLLSTSALMLVISSALTVTSMQESAYAGPIASINGCPLLSGHRGSPRSAPENTVQSYQAAANLNADIMEIDARFNKSDFLFSLHDATLDRTTTGTGSLKNYWLPDANLLSAADFTETLNNVNWRTSAYGGFHSDGKPKTKIPYAWDILNVAKNNGLTVLIDLKETPTQAQMAKWMEYVDRPEFNYRSKLIWMVSTPSLINTMKVTWGYNDMPYYLFSYNLTTDSMWTGSYLNKIGADGVAIPPQFIGKNELDYWKSFGKKIITWTSDPGKGYDAPATWRRMADAGVDIVTTNEVEWYRDWCLAGMPASMARPS